MKNNVKKIVKTLPFLLSLLIVPSSAFAQQEFSVNSTLASAQRDPQIVRDSSGHYAVIWKSENQIDSSSKGDIFLQFYNSADQPIGSEILVNTVTAGDQDKPSAAMNAKGDLIVTWASHAGFEQIYDIQARIFHDRIPAAPEFTVNSTLPYTQTNPDAAANASGNFIVVWDSWNQDGSDKGVYSQRISSSGAKSGTEFRVNSTTSYSQAKPSVQYFLNGKFVVVWESWRQDESSPAGYGVYGRIFNSDGSASSAEFPVNTFVRDYQWYADVETFSDNTFAVVWCSWEQDGYDGGIYLQRFSSEAEKLGTEQLINQTTSEYQWLPKITRGSDDSFVLIWSSWKQDGNREGVYARRFRKNGIPITLESRVNDYTVNFQWEPDVMIAPQNPSSLVAAWSTWGKMDKDYDVAAKRFSIPELQGYFDPQTYSHPSGYSTSKFIVHRFDSTALTGHQYEVSFDSLGAASYRTVIVDKTDGDTVVPNFTINKGEKTFYVSEMFDGVAVEIRPEMDLELDGAGSYFKNTSGTNALFTFTNPTVGTKLTAPIDIILAWGNSDTAAAGTFVSPSDTAINNLGQRVVAIPFKAMNMTDRTKIDFLVTDVNNNKRFDFGEKIIVLTPLKYRKTAANTHCQITNSVTAANPKWPSAGDSMFINTTRPLTKNDRYHFTTTPATIMSAGNHYSVAASSFSLEQNYPNPFNPSTTIRYSVENPGRVRLRIFNVLGQEVRMLVNDVQDRGKYRISFSAEQFSSGIYFYSLETDNRSITKKMIYMR